MKNVKPSRRKNAITLSADTCSYIRGLYKSGWLTKIEIARKYDITVVAVTKIIEGKKL